MNNVSFIIDDIFYIYLKISHVLEISSAFQPFYRYIDISHHQAAHFKSSSLLSFALSARGVIDLACQMCLRNNLVNSFNLDINNCNRRY